MSSPVYDRNHLRFSLVVFVVLLIAAGFRSFGINWDDGHYFHPDERFIATVMHDRISLPGISDARVLLDPAHSPLNTRSVDADGNPRTFAYGSLPLIVTTVLAYPIESIAGIELTSYGNVGLFGRALTSLVDLGTILFVMLFARRTFGELAAIIAGSLTASSVILIQLAHFFTVDTWVTFFVAATLYGSLHVLERFSLRWSLITAAFGGAALATKASVGVLGLPIMLAVVIGASRTHTSWRDTVRATLQRIALMAAPTLLVFMLFEPYALWRPGPFVDDIRTQWEIVNGQFDVPFTRQFIGTTPVVFELENLVYWGLAPAFGIASLIAVLVVLVRAIRTRDHRYLLLLSWLVPYFYVIASSEARFLRYSAPLVPVLAILVGHLLAEWWQGSGTRHAPRWWHYRPLAGTAIAGTILVTFIWAIAFSNVYAQTHPRIAASEWIYQNVPAGATLTREVWDDTLPVPLEGAFAPQQYEHLALDLYADRRTEEAFEYISAVLDDADYIVLASQRLSHSIPRSPWRYPVQSAFYRLLEQEHLGFELVHESSVYPGFGSWRVNTISADESFSVYDHPPVRIYQKRQELSGEQLELLFAHALNQPSSPARYPPASSTRASEPLDTRDFAGDVAWSDSITSRAPAGIVAWLIVLVLLASAGIPLAIRLFDTFPDSGVGFSGLVGLLGTGMLVWMLWSLEIASFGLLTTITALLVVAAVAWLGIGAGRETWHELRARIPFVVGSLAAFFVGFGLVLLLRALNPDLWHPFFGGEKPMETAYLNAIAHSASFPPYDPWFADGDLNYYYYGFFLIAVIARLSGVPLDLAYQLGIATIGGFLASGVFSLGSSLAVSVLHTRRSGWLLAGGGMSLFLTILSGNLDAARQVLNRGSLRVDFWESSRVVDFAINEFPYFSFLYGDLHPHLIAAPMLVLVLALGYSWILQGHAAELGWVILWTSSAAVVLSSAAMTNLWDGPTVVVLLLASLVMPLFRRRAFSRRRLFQFVVVAAATGLVAWLLIHPFLARFDPEAGGISVPDASTTLRAWTIHFGILIALAALVTVVAMVRLAKTSSLPGHHMLYGGGLAGLTFLASALLLSAAGPNFLGILIGGLVVTLAGTGIGFALGATAAGRFSGQALLVLVPFMVLGAALAPTRPVASASSFLVALFLLLWIGRPERSAATLLAIAGASAAGLVLVADLVYVQDHLRNSDWERMNTVFKLYFQAWILFAIVAAAAATWLIHRAIAITHVRPNGPGRQRPVMGISELPVPGSMVLLSGALVVLLAIALAYPVLATRDRLDHRMVSSPDGLSLSGYDWMEGGVIQNQVGEVIDFTGDFYAIQWLQQHAEGKPVVLEASIGPYRGGGSRISAATGLPTVLGWDSHQSQQRGADSVSPRFQDVREIYRTDDLDRKLLLLHRYGVEYVILGDVERFSILGTVTEGAEPDYYSSPEGLEAFDQLLGNGLELAFQHGATAVFRVTPAIELGTIP